MLKASLNFMSFGVHMNKLVEFLLFAQIVFLLSACQTSNKLQKDYLYSERSGTYLDEKFIGHQDVVIETPNEIFALSDEMKVIAKSIAAERSTHEKTAKLLQHFFSAENIKLAYKSGANVIATEAFQNKEANCLSLTILAYAIAQEAKLSVAFQRVDIPEFWVRNGRVNMLTGHINLSILAQKTPQKVVFWQRNQMEIDFDPFVLKRSFPKHKISKNTVLAMFYNNKGANAMIIGNYVTAYAYIRASTRIDPLFSPAWGNLGVLYRLTGSEQTAMETYRYAIHLNPSNLTSMSNLSMLLHVNGNLEEAKKLDNYIIRKRANNPYYYALLGDERLYQGAYTKAIAHYKKAIRLDDSIHDFYFGLAKVYLKLDEVEKAQRYMLKAIAKNRSPQIDKQYLAKLNILKKVELNQ